METSIEKTNLKIMVTTIQTRINDLKNTNE